MEAEYLSPGALQWVHSHVWGAVPTVSVEGCGSKCKLLSLSISQGTSCNNELDLHFDHNNQFYFLGYNICLLSRKNEHFVIFFSHPIQWKDGWSSVIRKTSLERQNWNRWDLKQIHTLKQKKQEKKPEMVPRIFLSWTLNSSWWAKSISITLSKVGAQAQLGVNYVLSNQFGILVSWVVPDEHACMYVWMYLFIYLFIYYIIFFYIY